MTMESLNWPDAITALGAMGLVAWIFYLKYMSG